MALQVYGFFDSTAQDGREYAENDMSRALHMISGDGVAALGDNLRVVSAQDGLNTRVLFGSAMCQGYYYALQDDGGDPMTLAHEAALSLPRVDRVVLRLDRNTDARRVTLAVRQGMPGASPEPPGLQRDDVVYELSLARVRVATGAGFLRDEDITDERDDETLCGRMGPAHTHAATDLTHGTLDCGFFTDNTDDAILAMHSGDPYAHENIMLDGNAESAGTQSDWEQHMADPNVHANIIVDGNNS
jgi:hypothetical protein